MLQLLNRILNARDEVEGREILLEGISEKIAELSGNDLGGIDPEAPLFSFGLNSLQLVQLKSWTDQALPVNISITQMNQYTTINSLVDLLLESMISKAVQEMEGLLENDNGDNKNGRAAALAKEVGNRKAADPASREAEELVVPVNDVTDPDLVAFMFPGIEGNVDFPAIMNGQGSKLPIPNANKIQLCVVKMKYSAEPEAPIDWMSDVDNAVNSVRKFMEGLWSKHRDDANTLPFVFVGRVFGAVVAVEAAHAMQVACGLCPVNIVVIHMCSPQMLAHKYNGAQNGDQVRR